MWVRVVIAIVLLLSPTAVFAQTGKRIALLIGNKDYKTGVGALTNPLNDIRIVGQALRAVGFEVLKPTQNATRAVMLRAILEFTAKLKDAGPDAVGFVYYSGHGIASAGENYLIPVDVEEPSTVELSVQGVKHSEVLAILRGEAPNAAHYLVLDACRNTLQGARGGKGFVPVGQQSGVLVAFATEPGKTASDTGQGSGPYAAALAAELVKPGQNDLLMFHNVRVAVMDMTNRDQVPWTEDGIQRRQRLLFGGEGKSAPTPQPQRLSEAAEAWSTTKDSTSTVVLEAFITQFKDTIYAGLARARIKHLTKPPAASQAPPTITGMLRCEAYADRGACQGDTLCSWADVRKQCERKSGGLSTALLEASPSKRVPEPSCVGVETLIGNTRRCLKSRDSFKDCPDCPEMVVVPAGNFVMGSPVNEKDRDQDEGPQRKVTIARPFAVGKFEVTAEEWDRCAAESRCRPSGQILGRGKHPVVDVSWNDITKEYLPWLSQRTGEIYRLLTEAEWEYVARANTTTPFSMGPTITPEQANFNGNFTRGGSTKGQNRGNTVEVGSFQPNAFGLYDMHGNVWEWTEDCYKNAYTDAPTDGSAVESGDCNLRILRGGSWSSAEGLRSADRGRNSTDRRDNDIGFRVARSP